MTITVVRPPQPPSELPPQPTLELSPSPVAVSRPVAAPGRRDRYIDSLRVLALIRVMTYHVFGWAWLPILFPSMGIMFALAGSLIASSLDRSPGNPWLVLKKRGIRLLPPVWLFGVVTIPIMLVAGWTHSESAGEPLSWQTLLFWVVPISDPPGSELGADWVSPLWYIRAYLWFLLLSPATLWLFRHWPKRMLAIPLTVALLYAFGLLSLDSRSGDVILTIAMFGGCWMLGFAHHDGKIRRMPLIPVLIGGAALMALGLTWSLTHSGPSPFYDIDNIPMADTLYSLGAVLILLRIYPDFSWMEKRVVLDKLVTAINSRAMTIYLWGNLAIFLSNPILDAWTVTAELDEPTMLGSLQMYLASWLILIALVLLFGWCEDLAARRPLRINPWPRSTPQLATMRIRRVRAFPNLSWMAALRHRRRPIATAGFFALASGLLAVALAGTQFSGRAATADVPSRTAIPPRTDTNPPAGSGTGNSQAIVTNPPRPRTLDIER